MYNLLIQVFIVTIFNCSCQFLLWGLRVRVLLVVARDSTVSALSDSFRRATIATTFVVL